MKLDGKRVRISRWIHGESCVVKVDVEAVLPVDDPSEPCLESETIEYLRIVRDHADRGDVEWLKGVGEVYAKVPA